MDLLIALLTVVLVTAAVFVISAPLRRERSGATAGAPSGDGRAAAGDDADGAAAERAELEAEREAKYREIRDAELDFRTGKLSPEDYRAVDGQLRAEAVAILDRLERLAESGG